MNNMFSLSTSARRARPISLTALIDVVFILLMFFMLTSSFSQWQMLDLTIPSTHQAAKDDVPPVIIVYGDDMGLLTDTLKRPINISDLPMQLTGEALTKPIILSAEEAVSLSRIIATYEQLKQLGFNTIHISQAIKSTTQGDENEG
ncbi:MAG: biopolymer transporter ExbD [Thalassolituus oleivorans]|nr:biopolymer transporter ExbD [Thalassolituus oleivorans]